MRIRYGCWSKAWSRTGFKKDSYGGILRTEIHTEEELEDLSYYPGLFAIFRNELYARHGYLFQSQSWNEFFSAYSWYDGRIPSNAFDVSCMN